MLIKTNNSSFQEIKKHNMFKIITQINYLTVCYLVGGNVFASLNEQQLKQTFKLCANKCHNTKTDVFYRIKSFELSAHINVLMCSQ